MGGEVRHSKSQNAILLNWTCTFYFTLPASTAKFSFQ